jgi:signal transduction histidine kinase
LLASLFLVAILVDVSQPARAPAVAYAILLSYLTFAAAVAYLTWNNWWLDAKSAGPVHATDILVFSALVALTRGYTSPAFTYFTFLLLSAAIRWGWREMALTAILLTLLYLVTGLLAIPSENMMELQRFVVRTGHFVILALILMWFGINQWTARGISLDGHLISDSSLDRSPVESGLRAAMSSVRAERGSFVWFEMGQSASFAICEGKTSAVAASEAWVMPALSSSAFLYDLPKGRALARDAERNLVAMDPRSLILPVAAASLRLTEGIAIPIRADSGEGLLFLEGVSNLSIDHIDLGQRIASDIAGHFQSHALIRAAEENAEGRSRLALARDLHDSVVQFLAGAAFRLEAVKRSLASGRNVETDLNELKQLMLQEQAELRSFITALRARSQIALSELSRDLKGLCGRLSRQWGISCDITTKPGKQMVPARLHRDIQQLVREAVANAVRHASATTVTVDLAARPDEVRLEVVNDGAEYPRTADSYEMPRSMRERVDRASGEMEISRGMGVTRLLITLPVGEELQ